MINKNISTSRLEAIKITCDVCIIKNLIGIDDKELFKNRVELVTRKFNQYENAMALKQNLAFAKNIQWGACRKFIYEINRKLNNNEL